MTINGLSSGGDGLVGQIIVNGTNTVGKWLSPVVVGGTTLSPVPYYNDLSSDLGGGAVGLVPYYLHYNDCTPTATKVNENQITGLDGYDPSQCAGIHIDKVLGPGEILQTITLNHYGPIAREGTGMPVTIHRRPMAEIDCQWTDVTTSFTHFMHPASNTREVRIDGPFTEGYYYIIEPKRDTGSVYLACDNTELGLPNPEPVKDYDLVVRVRRIQDLTLNGLLQPDDITAWIANPQDTTLDGMTDNNDLVDVINAVAE